MKPVFDGDKLFYCIGGRTAMVSNPVIRLRCRAFRAKQRVACTIFAGEPARARRGSVRERAQGDGCNDRARTGGRQLGAGATTTCFEDPDGIRLEVCFVPGAGLLAPGTSLIPLRVISEARPRSARTPEPSAGLNDVSSRRAEPSQGSRLARDQERNFRSTMSGRCRDPRHRHHHRRARAGGEPGAGDMGAEVIQVETPEATRSRSRAGAASRHGRLISQHQPQQEKSRARPEAAGGVRRVVAAHGHGDVFCTICDGAATRLGIDYAAIRQANPRIVYAWASGYRANGPGRDRAAFD